MLLCGPPSFNGIVPIATVVAFDSTQEHRAYCDTKSATIDMYVLLPDFQGKGKNDDFGRKSLRFVEQISEIKSLDFV